MELACPRVRTRRGSRGAGPIPGCAALVVWGRGRERPAKLCVQDRGPEDIEVLVLGMTDPDMLDELAHVAGALLGREVSIR